MTQLFEILSKNYDLEQPALIQSIENSEKDFKWILPWDVKEVVLYSNGIEGETN